MSVKPIRSEQEYRRVLKQASALIDNPPEFGGPQGDAFELLLMVIEAYEDEHFPIALPDPIEAIKFRMEQAGLAPKDLVPMIGPLNRVYQVLAGTRTLTIPMIRRLHAGLGISADVLIAAPRRAEEVA